MSIFGTPTTGDNSNYPLGAGQGTMTSSDFSTSVGDLIVVNVISSDGASAPANAPTIVDVAGNSYTSLTYRNGSGSYGGRWFYCLAATMANGNNHVTVTYPNTGTLSGVVCFNFPLGGTALYDFDTDIVPNQSSPGHSPSFSGTGTDELIVAVAFDTSRITTFVAGSGYTAHQVSGSFTQFMAGEYGDFAPTLPTQSTFTWASGSTAIGVMSIGFKAASAPAAPTQPIVVIMG
jgi:hypothetical protein